MAAERRYRDVLQTAGVEEDFIARKSSVMSDNSSTYGLDDNNDDDDDKLSYTLSKELSKHSPDHTAGTISQYSDNYDEDFTKSSMSPTRSRASSTSAPVYVEGSDISENLDSDAS